MPDNRQGRAGQGPAQKEKTAFRPKLDRFPDIRGGGAPRGAAGALIELDKEIMKLLVRRAKLVGRIRGGKDHASTPQAILEEKSVRTAWEANALSFSKDPRFCRQLFNLLQDLKVLTKEEAEGGAGFGLAPSKQPVRVSIAGPAKTDQAQMWAALAAGLGRDMALPSLLPAAGLMDLVKAYNQAGAALSWANTGTGMGALYCKSGAAACFAGKNIYVGDSLLSLHLLAFAAAGATGVTSLTGGTELKGADLSPLRHTLPLLGARLAHKIPRSVGLPATLECSGVLPDEIPVPEDLPYEGLCALLLAPFVWNKPMRFDLSQVPAATASAALSTVDSVYRQLGVSVEIQGTAVIFTSMDMVFPQEPALEIDPALAGYLLALPAFLGGECVLHGKWNARTGAAGDVQALLTWAGLSVRDTGADIRSGEGDSPFCGALHGFDSAGQLAPLYYALAAKAAFLSSGPFSLPVVPEEDDAYLVQDFFARLGLAMENGALTRQKSVFAENGTSSQHSITDKKQNPLPWTSPNAYWSMAFSLVAALSPGLCLSNPHGVSALMPAYWAIYNGLPVPRDPAAPAVKAEKESDNARTARRRIIAE